MFAHLLLVATLATPSAAGSECPLFATDFGPEAPALELTDGAVVEGGRLVLGDGAAAATHDAFSGDIELRAIVSALEPGASVRLALEGGAVFVEATRPAGGDEARGALRLYFAGAGEAEAAVVRPAEPFDVRLVVRSAAAEVWFGDAHAGESAAAALVGTMPLEGSRVVLSASGGRAELDDVSVRRLAWFDGVRVTAVEGAVDAARLATLPRESFRLLDPPPSRIDPVWRIAIDRPAGTDAAAGPAAIEVATCGPRLADDVVPLLAQGLALARIRPWASARVYEGTLFPLDDADDADVAGHADDAGDSEDERLPRTLLHTFEDLFAAPPAEPIDVALPQGPCSIDVDALVGFTDHLPIVTLIDVTNDQVLDLGIAGGPMGRTMGAPIPPACERLDVEFVVPGIGTRTCSFVLTRS